MVYPQDFEVKPHPACSGGTHAVAFFPNGYGVSIVTGAYFYSNTNAPYELALLTHDPSEQVNEKGEKQWTLDYDHPASQGDVRGYLTLDELNELIAQVEKTEASHQAKAVAANPE